MSVAEINQPVAVPERVKRVMRMISVAAEQGLRSPTNQEIADALDASSVSAGANIVALLETMGLISVTRFQVGRVITIAGTGQSTLPLKGKLHWSVRGVVRKQSRPPVRSSDPETTGTYRGPAPVSQLVERDPCPRCGIRGDIGCQHHSALFGMGAF